MNTNFICIWNRTFYNAALHIFTFLLSHPSPAPQKQNTFSGLLLPLEQKLSWNSRSHINYFLLFFLNLPSPSSLSKSNSFSKHVRNIPHLGPSCHFSDCLSASRHVSLDRQDEPDLPNKGFPNSFSYSFSLMWCEEFIFSSLRLPHKPYDLLHDRAKGLCFPRSWHSTQRSSGNAHLYCFTA